MKFLPAARLAKRSKIGYTIGIMRNFCFLEDIMDEQKTTGTLYIVATPIGNSRDMSERGREILSTADIIAAEDTRRSVVLLNKLGIRGNSLSANHKFNEYGKAKWFIEQLASGKDIAVITDAGTPCISDPGNELIRAAVENGIRVVGVPGCCAAVNALSISGFDLSSFLFYGFFPRETADRRRVLMMMRKGDTATYAFYESPKRIMSVIDFFIEENAQLRLCLCNDMTKLHEMTFRGTPAGGQGLSSSRRRPTKRANTPSLSRSATITACARSSTSPRPRRCSSTAWCSMTARPRTRSSCS